MQQLRAANQQRLTHRAHGGLGSAASRALLARVQAAEVGVAEEAPIHMDVPDEAKGRLEHGGGNEALRG